MSNAERSPRQSRHRALVARVSLGVLLVLGLPAGVAQAQGQAQVVRDPVRFTPVVFSDPMAGGIAAVSVLVPDGWEATGGIEWLPAWSRVAAVTTYLRDPATGLVIAWLPIQDFMHFPPPAGFSVPLGANYQGKAYVPPIRNPERFVEAFWMPSVLGHLQGASLVDRRRVPVVADGLLEAFGGPGEAGAWVLRYAYDVNGVPWEQDVSFALLWSEANGITSWYVNLAWTVAGPAGTIDTLEGTIGTIVASRTTTPEWEATYRVVQRLFYQGIQQQMADTVRFGELLAQHRAESQRLQEAVVAERWASQDRIAQQRRDVLGGVSNHVDPRTGTIVQLPSTWDTYWVNDRGEYLVTDDPSLDPAGSDASGWRRLQPRD